MGRPINKKYLGDAVGSIKVSHYRRSTGAEVTGEDDTYIVSQRSNNKFLIADTSGGWSEILELVNKNAGALANGEFRIAGVDADGNAVNITRLHNRQMRFAASGRQSWSVATSTPVTVAGVTLPSADVVSIEATGHGFSTGDVVTFQSVGGAVELNGEDYVITVTDANNFTLDGTDGDNFTAYTSGGEIFIDGDKTIIDLQDA